MKRLETRPPEVLHPRRCGATAPAAETTTEPVLALPTLKVKEWHRQRKAIVYIRQSTPQQVLEHRESADRQYSLVHRAVLLGWPEDRVEVVDEDQGRSGQSAEGRLGF